MVGLIPKSIFTTNFKVLSKLRNYTRPSGTTYLIQKRNHETQRQGEKYFEVHNPANGELLGTIIDQSEVDANDAVLRAYEAFQTWRKTTGKERSGILRTWFDLINSNAEDLATLITKEMGKPLCDARAEIKYGAGFVEWYAEEAKRTYGDIIPSSVASKRILVIKEPIGVAAMITPWNFPHAMITRKAAPALAAGCTVVLRAAEDTPYSALALSELATEAGFPPGVLNVLTSSEENARGIGKVLCEHPLVSHLSFTGSTAVGKILLAQTASTVKKVSLELGGNAPFIVFNSADINKVVRAAMVSKFRCSGQTCVCPNRILVQEGVYKSFVTALKEAMMTGLRVGDGLLPGVTQGPLVNQRSVEKIEHLVNDAVSKGATVVHGGKRLGGLFYEPTLLADVTKHMQITQEEIFGPVAAIQKFTTEAEALRLANDTNMGLASYIFSEDMNQCIRMTENLEYGMVAVNEGLLPTSEAPMGGVKQSGLGREGSKYGIEEFLEMKYLCLGSVA